MKTNTDPEINDLVRQASLADAYGSEEEEDVDIQTRHHEMAHRIREGLFDESWFAARGIDAHKLAQAILEGRVDHAVLEDRLRGFAK